MATQKKTKTKAAPKAAPLNYKELPYEEKLKGLDLYDIKSLVQGMSLTVRNEARTLESKARKLVMALNIPFNEAMETAKQRLEKLEEKNATLRRVASVHFGINLRK